MFPYDLVRNCAGLAVALFRFGCNYLRVWALRRRGLVCVGNSYISRKARFSNPAQVAIGTNCSISKVFFYALDQISVGDHCVLGDDIFLCTGSHDIYSAKFDLVTKPIHIGRYVWIANGVTVLAGVTIGDGAVIGTMAVVSRDVPPGGVAVGNPARLVKIGRPIPAGFDPLTLAPIDYSQPLERLRRRFPTKKRTTRAAA